MRHLITLFIFIFIAGSMDAYAQQRGQRGQKGPKQTKEERVDAMTTRLYVALELNDSQMKDTKKILLNHINEVEKIREDAEGSRPDLELIGKSMNDMDASFKEIFTEEQYTKFTDMKDKLFQRRRGMRNSQRSRKSGNNQRRGW